MLFIGNKQLSPISLWCCNILTSKFWLWITNLCHNINYHWRAMTAHFIHGATSHLLVYKMFSSNRSHVPDCLTTLPTTHLLIIFVFDSMLGLKCQQHPVKPLTDLFVYFFQLSWSVEICYTATCVCGELCWVPDGRQIVTVAGGRSPTLSHHRQDKGYRWQQIHCSALFRSGRLSTRSYQSL